MLKMGLEYLPFIDLLVAIEKSKFKAVVLSMIGRSSWKGLMLLYVKISAGR